MYTPMEVNAIASEAARQALLQVLNLDNGIELLQQNEMARLKQQVNVNGVERWITGSTMQDMFNSYLSFCLQQGVVAPPIAAKAQTHTVPTFGKYILNFNRVYKSKQESLTMECRNHITNKHIIPKWGETELDEIKTSDLQLWFNELEDKGYSHETLLKIKNNMSPAFDAAVEDGYIVRNPMKSARLKIGGAETVHHKAIPAEKMKEIRDGIQYIEDSRVRIMAALLCYTGMRMEEILGLKWEDIDTENNWIHVKRAVVHPGRNLPEVKEPKSQSSKRKIPLTNQMKLDIGKFELTGFVLCNKDGTPLSYTAAKYCMSKIRTIFGIKEYTAHDFRDTCATEWREAGIPTDIIARLLGHSKSDITENRYVKYRDEVFQGVRCVMETISGTQNGTK